MGGHRKKNEEIVAQIILADTHVDKGRITESSARATAAKILDALRMTPENVMKRPSSAFVSSRKGQERVQRIQKRCDWLEKRIREASPDRNMSFDSQELSALRGAIEIIEQVGIVEEELAESVSAKP